MNNLHKKLFEIYFKIDKTPSNSVKNIFEILSQTLINVFIRNVFVDLQK